MRVIAFSLLAACAAMAQAGDVYKWVDANGVVHYGDKPKQGGEAVDVKPDSGTGEPSADAKTEAERAANCERKRQQLQTYKNAATVKETDSLGRVREYSQQERQQLLEQTEKQVAEACAPPKPAQ